MDQQNRSVRKFRIFALAVLLCVLFLFNLDPVGDAAVQWFGRGADVWAMNIVLIAAIVYAILMEDR